MKCLSPILLRNRGTQLKDGTYTSDYSQTTQYVEVPCGKCYNCLARKRNQWFCRISQEIKYSDSVHFVTLTYSDDAWLGNLTKNTGEKLDPLPYSIDKSHLQLFFKRLRKLHKFRYFAVGEYGSESLRPHYHIILFNYPKERVYEDIQACWYYGMIDVSDDINPGVINYTVKYIVNGQDDRLTDEQQKNFMLCSKAPAIGYSFLEDYRNIASIENNPDGRIRDEYGNSFSMPRYYKDKTINADPLLKLRNKQLNQIYDYKQEQQEHKLKFKQRDQYFKYKSDETRLSMERLSSLRKQYKKNDKL